MKLKPLLCIFDYKMERGKGDAVAKWWYRFRLTAFAAIERPGQQKTEKNVHNMMNDGGTDNERCCCTRFRRQYMGHGVHSGDGCLIDYVQ